MVCGWLEVAPAAILAKEPGRFKLPIPSFLIEHPRAEQSLILDRSTLASARE
jgi:hypothetical protein